MYVHVVDGEVLTGSQPGSVKKSPRWFQIAQVTIGCLNGFQWVSILWFQFLGINGFDFLGMNGSQC